MAARRQSTSSFSPIIRNKAWICSVYKVWWSEDKNDWLAGSSQQSWRTSHPCWCKFLLERKRDLLSFCFSSLAIDFLTLWKLTWKRSTLGSWSEWFPKTISGPVWMWTTSRQSGRRTRQQPEARLDANLSTLSSKMSKCSSFFMCPCIWTRLRFSVGVETAPQHHVPSPCFNCGNYFWKVGHCFHPSGNKRNIQVPETKKKKKKLWLSQIREKVQFFLNSPSCFGWLQANYVETGNWKQCGGQFSISNREEIWIAGSEGLDWVLWLGGVKTLGRECKFGGKRRWYVLKWTNQRLEQVDICVKCSSAISG